MTVETRPRSRMPNSALLLMDVVNDFAFGDGPALFRNFRPQIKNLSRLKEKAQKLKVPVIYVNDNYGRWNEDFAGLVNLFRETSEQAAYVIDRLGPDPQDYYILKPHRSGFYETPLQVLLERLRVGHLIITGITTDLCVLFTANDAYMRGLRISVPGDCTTAVKKKAASEALAFLKRTCDADTRPYLRIKF
ncbi:MAG: cysteine hydrolase [Acidobacteria bacterium]|nr:cysteine hydrolase [Acidobacteriota bacterium]